MSASRNTLLFEIADVIQLASPVSITRQDSQVIAERVVKLLEAKAESIETMFNIDAEPEDQLQAIPFEWLINSHGKELEN